MRNISRKELKKILKEHELWLKNEGGKRADLSDADLRCADLAYANLRYADLSDADLSYADLSNANLRGAYLRFIDLRYANLEDTNLICTNLEYADLNNADLSEADLRYANLNDANLEHADLENANLLCADLRCTNLKDIKINIYTIGYNLSCPEKGSFIGYKKAGDWIIELLIPDDAKRSSATSSKCRTNKVKVLDIENIKTRNKVKEINSDYDNNFIYRVGEIVYVDNFNEYRWEECTSGIHFFMNKEDAINY